MSHLFLHGLGQSPDAWAETLRYLNLAGDVCCPDLSGLLTRKPAQWGDLYAAFCRSAQHFQAPLHLCGLSLGAVLALQYAVEHPQGVESLVLIAPQYKMPRALLQFQSALFRLMPPSSFRDMGLQKEDFLSLTRSMADIDLSRDLNRVSCPVLILCGERDRANRKAAQRLAQLLPRGRFLPLPGAGHEVNVDAPQLLGAQLVNFYQSIS